MTYKFNITTDSDHLLIPRDSRRGAVNKISIVNKGLKTAVSIFLKDMVTGGNPEYSILKTTMPPSTNILLDDKELLNYDSGKYELRFVCADTASAGNSTIDIIIK
ncbi:hypothetical protein [uncultured virus]|uniref:Uncharacterized protein n=1 Tax=uncultured virus TaxID=340016 RepID=A0A218MLR3_9VIRU|nr:hypothetical protein [uncultured virus]|tara:strand:+ start:299 stop:613 length:315 start_codon:yes stop_codon:yes gene_type:complete